MNAPIISPHSKLAKPVPAPSAGLRRCGVAQTSSPATNHNINGRADFNCTRLNFQTTPPACKRRALSTLLSLKLDVIARYVNKRLEPCCQIYHSSELDCFAGLRLHVPKMGELETMVVSARLA
jgi:hypothetical protein